MFRASIVDRDLRHTTEMMFFWRYIPGDNLHHILNRQLSVLFTPAAGEEIGRQPTVVSLIHKVAENFMLRPPVPHNPMSSGV